MDKAPENPQIESEGREEASDVLGSPAVTAVIQNTRVAGSGHTTSNVSGKYKSWIAN